MIAAPPTQPCCGKTHPLPFLHRKPYTDKRGRRRQIIECARCYKTRHQDGHAIRWSKPGSPYCGDCEQAMRALIYGGLS
jgi:hypothetical protein